MKRLRHGAILLFILAIGHLGCPLALDEAFDAYGIKDVTFNMVSGHIWIKNIFKKTVDNVADKFLFMSATILNPTIFCKNLG